MSVLGYGIGGYGGLDEPWGSVEFLLGDLLRDSNRSDYMGIIEALSSVIGEADNAIGGLYSTRLTSAASEGSVDIDVESTLNWSTANGKIGIDGVVYYYTTLTDTTINGLSYINNGVLTSGTAKIHNINSEVVNLNRELSAIDLARRALLIDYAEGPYLDVIGRRLGVPRKPLYGDDDLYRAIIKAIAYSPKGTTYGIELALNALLGLGNYEIYEDLVEYPCQVFIKVDEASLLQDNPYGKTYLSGPLYGVTSGSYDTIVLSEEPLQVAYVKLYDLGEVFDFRGQIPGDVQYAYYPGATVDDAFTYSGGLSESNVTENDYYTIFNAGSAGTVYYDMLDSQGARIDINSVVILDQVINIPNSSVLSSGKLKQVSFSIYDGNRNINIGIDDDYSFGIFETEVGGFLGSSVVLDTDVFYNVKVVKNKDVDIKLYVDGVLITTVLYSSFSGATSNHKISFGLQGTPSSGCEFYIKQMGINIQNGTDFWASSYDSLGSVTTVDPPTYTISGTHSFVSGDIGKCFEVTNSSVDNGYGGNNNCKATIATVASSLEITLAPIGFTRGTIEGGLFYLPDYAEKFKYPDDLGKQIQITNSALGNNGIYTITDLYVENSLQTEGAWLNLSDYDTDNTEYTNVAALNSSYLIDEVELEFDRLINFVTESNIGFVHSESGTQSGDTLTLKTPLWDNDLLVEVGISNVLTGQLMIDTDIHNTIISTDPLLYGYYPFYLSDTMGDFKSFIDDLTIAGVIPSVLGM